MKENVNLTLIKSFAYKNIYSFRFHKTSNTSINGLSRLTLFASALTDEGYKVNGTSNVKQVFENKSYKIVIVDIFDYLNIIIERK
jgi:hypothetical protein